MGEKLFIQTSVFVILAYINNSKLQNQTAHNWCDRQQGSFAEHSL